MVDKLIIEWIVGQMVGIEWKDFWMDGKMGG